MTLPNWLGIPGVILLFGLIAYGFWQGGRLKTPNRDGASGDPSPLSPSDSSFDHHG